MKQVSQCVAALQDVRRSMQDDADPRIVAALDQVIADLKRCVTEGKHDDPHAVDAALRALAVIGDILACLNGVAELVKYFSA